ncbi:hypothetical protein A6M21_11600 [Desulfotomaculum copahuensis]|uniref:phospholipase D n=2 Tax=Desulfotomaculum copahuensis TaxID=1838280 RepID=A0A1B7LDR6_9FIRM|nr:hypothetical protein A6M21_11600 [Desulfotomaculum copahuensis]
MALLLLAATIAGCARNVSVPGLSPATDNTAASRPVVYFPRAGQDPAPVLAGMYDGAKKSLDVAVYSLTHPQIVKAIINAHKRGVQVRVITDREQAAGASQKHAMASLLLAGVPVMVNDHSGLMHLKMSIIDGRVATTGSYNYTRSASERNDEMFVVSADPAFVNSCRTEFEHMWADQKKFARLKGTGY